jgi:hypothetical protein
MVGLGEIKGVHGHPLPSFLVPLYRPRLLRPTAKPLLLTKDNIEYWSLRDNVIIPTYSFERLSKNGGKRKEIDYLTEK